MTESSVHKKVELVIDRVSEMESIGRDEARALVHKYVCGGGCSWYKTKSKKAGFNRLDLKAQQKKLIEEAAKEVFKGFTVNYVKVQIHKILCPGQSRTCQKKAL